MGSSTVKATWGMNFSVPPFFGSAAMAQAATPSRRAPSRAAEPTREGNSPGRPLMARVLSLKKYDAQLSTQPYARALHRPCKPWVCDRLRPTRAVAREGKPKGYRTDGEERQTAFLRRGVHEGTPPGARYRHPP